jgi:hypothetical protein
VVNTAPLAAELAADASLLCACLAGAATIRQIEDWLAAAGFIDISIITIKPGSRELVESWAPGRGIEDYAASATIEARKPGSFSTIGDCIECCDLLHLQQICSKISPESCETHNRPATSVSFVQPDADPQPVIAQEYGVLIWQ